VSYKSGPIYTSKMLKMFRQRFTFSGKTKRGAIQQNYFLGFLISSVQMKEFETRLTVEKSSTHFRKRRDTGHQLDARSLQVRDTICRSICCSSTLVTRYRMSSNIRQELFFKYSFLEKRYRITFWFLRSNKMM
jgi:hypothetical protein